MAFALAAGVITQTGGDINLSGLAAATFTSPGTGTPAITLSYDGAIRIYTMESHRLDIEGTLTINPEIERLVLGQSYALSVQNGGRLNLGTDVVRNRDVRFSEGLALVLSNAPPAWHSVGSTTSTTIGNQPAPSGTTGSLAGYAAGMRIQNGGILDWRGATVAAVSNMGFLAGSRILIQDATLQITEIMQQSPPGVIDPDTGSRFPATPDPRNNGLPNAAGVGVRRNGGQASIFGRGYISGFQTTDLAINGFTLQRGGEVIFGVEPATGSSTVITEVDRGIRNYGAQHVTIAAFPNRTSSIDFTDTALSGGNNVDVTIQSEGEVSGTVNADEITNTRIFNEVEGTNLRAYAVETGTQVRNQGSVHIYRNIQLRANALDTGSAIVDGGRWFIRDHNNGFRSNAAGIDDTADNLYGGGFVGGTANQASILLGAVKADTTAYMIGSTAQTLGNKPVTTTNAPSANNPYSMDLRGNRNLQGTDEFDIHVWHELYQYFPILNTDLSDGTTGTREFTLNLATDTQYQTGPFASNTRIANLDELYKAEKLRKIQASDVNTPTGIELPTPGTMYMTATAGVLNLGGNTLVTSSVAPNQYQVAAAGGINTVTINSLGLVSGTLITSLVMAGTFDSGANRLPGFPITAATFLGLPGSGALDQEGGVYSGDIHITANGSYSAVGNWADANVVLSSGADNVTITFSSDAVVPTATPPSGVTYTQEYSIPVTASGRALMYNVDSQVIVGTVQDVSPTTPIVFTSAQVNSDSTNIKVFFKQTNDEAQGNYYSITESGNFTRNVLPASVSGTAIPSVLTQVADLPAGTSFSNTTITDLTTSVLNTEITSTALALASTQTRNLMLQIADSRDYFIVAVNAIDGSQGSNEPIEMGTREVEYDGDHLNFVAPVGQQPVVLNSFVQQSSGGAAFSSTRMQQCAQFTGTSSPAGATPGEVITAAEQGLRNAGPSVIDTELRRSPATKAGRR